MNVNIHVTLKQLVTAAIDKPSSENYQALLEHRSLSYELDQSSAGDVGAALIHLDFTRPPVDLAQWYKHWYDCIERNPELFENLVLPEDSPQWALFTLAKAVGFAYQSATALDKRALNTNMMAQAFAQAIAASDKAKEHGKRWINSVESMRTPYGHQLVTMLGLTVLPDATTDLMLALDSYHRKWTQLVETDLSRALLARVLGESKEELFALVVEWHDKHAERCIALRAALAPSLVATITLPDSVSGPAKYP